MLLYAEELYDAIKVVSLAAWTDVANVYFGIPRIEVTAYPHVVIRMDSVPIEAVFGTQEHIYTFDVIYRGAWSTTANFNIELQKIARANEFITEFTSSTTLGDYGYMPSINQVSFSEADDPNEPFYELVINLSCVVHTEYTES